MKKIKIMWLRFRLNRERNELNALRRRLGLMSTELFKRRMRVRIAEQEDTVKKFVDKLNDSA